MCCDLCGDFIKYLDGIERFWKLYMYIGSRLASENTEIETLPHISSFCRIYFSSHKNEIGSRRRDEPREKMATENVQIVYIRAVEQEGTKNKRSWNEIANKMPIIGKGENCLHHACTCCPCVPNYKFPFWYFIAFSGKIYTITLAHFSHIVWRVFWMLPYAMANTSTTNRPISKYWDIANWVLIH